MGVTTFQFRVKDATTGKHLARHARAVTFVWNYCCGAQRHAMKWNRKWPSAFDLIKLCTGAAADLGLHSDTVQTVCREFAARRDAIRRCPGWRSAKKSLGWVPFIPRAIRVNGPQVTYLKRKFWFWKSREIDGQIKAGSFRVDARGRWYVNFQCEIPDGERRDGPHVGIDLGLKSFAVLSDGRSIAAPRIFRAYEAALGRAQRAGNKRRAKAIHAKIANARKHFLHEQSTQLVRTFSYIAVGNVNAKRLTQTRMAKSVLDAGWSAFRHMLRYKGIRHGVLVEEVDERHSSATCSSCGARSGPKGIAGLRIRSFECSCGAVHDRDHNAARNILNFGLDRQAPVVEIPVL